MGRVWIMVNLEKAEKLRVGRVWINEHSVFYNFHKELELLCYMLAMSESISLTTPKIGATRLWSSKFNSGCGIRYLDVREISFHS